MKIAILMGGDGPEREVSFKSGREVQRALEKYHTIILFDPAKKNFCRKILKAKPDFVFIALHGGMGESGIIQGFLETAGIPYSGSGVFSSALCMDKIATKRILLSHGITTPPFLALNTPVASAKIPFRFPVVVKPAGLGSTIGISIVEDPADMEDALQKAFSFDRSVLIEKFVKGTEITAGLLGNESPRVLPLIEIRTERELYDYTAKYVKGQSIHIIPPQLDRRTLSRVEKIALASYQILKCRGFGRMEMIVDRKGIPWVLEVNTIPGFTSVSLLPDAAAHAGIDFETLCNEIVKLGCEK
ncbi:MAG: D-alanine--D-alanine ligase [Candidatus Ratteibacteria bacterium]